MSKRLKSDALLFLTAFIWGSAFVAQKVGADLGTFTYNGIRTFIGGLVLIPVIIILDKMSAKKGNVQPQTDEEKAAARKTLIIGGICCGLALFVASTLQQYGINFTTAGKAGFITSLYAIIVPIMSIFMGKKVRPIVWLCVVVGMFGMMGSVVNIDFSNFTESIPAYITIIAMPFAYSISDGIFMGIISYVILNVISGKENRKKISVLMYILAIIFLCKYLFV